MILPFLSGAFEQLFGLPCSQKNQRFPFHYSLFSMYQRLYNPQKRTRRVTAARIENGRMVGPTHPVSLQRILF